MPIQFFCPACRQPIEVDDEVANQTVTCPYCQKVVMAPPRSDPTIRHSAPDARLPEPVGPIPPGIERLAPPAGPPTGPNKLAWASLLCVIVCVISWVCLNVVILKMIGPVTQPLTPQDAQKRLSEATSAHPALTILLVISFVGGCVVPLAGIGLAIAALFSKRSPRWPAIVALCILGVLLVIACLNVVGQLAGAAPGK